MLLVHLPADEALVLYGLGNKRDISGTLFGLIAGRRGRREKTVKGIDVSLSY